MKHLLIITITLLALNPKLVFGQVELKVNTGLGTISTTNSRMLTYNRIIPQFSFDLGLGYSKHLPKNISIGASVHLGHNQSKEVRNSYYLAETKYTNGLIRIDQDEVTRTTENTFSCPVHLEYRVKKFALQIGWFLSYRLTFNSNTTLELSSDYFDEVYQSKQTISDINRYDHGPTLTLKYQIKPKLEFAVNSYYGIYKLGIVSSNNFTRRQITVGVCYRIK